MVLWCCPVLSGAGQPDPSLLMLVVAYIKVPVPGVPYLTLQVLFIGLILLSDIWPGSY